MNLKLNNLDVEIIQKNIKHVYLRVYPPSGRVIVSAPHNMIIDKIRTFVISKLNWVNKQQEKWRKRIHESTSEYFDHESHYFNGKRYLLQVVERNAAPKVSLTDSHIILQVRPGADEMKKSTMLDVWYGQQLKAKVDELITPWEEKMGVSVTQVKIRKMKTRWGSCSPLSRTIRINLELAKKPIECLEYVIVHELVHLLEPSHNKRFIALMNKFMPQWRTHRDELNTVS